MRRNEESQLGARRDRGKRLPSRDRSIAKEEKKGGDISFSEGKTSDSKHTTLYHVVDDEYAISIARGFLVCLRDSL